MHLARLQPANLCRLPILISGSHRPAHRPTQCPPVPRQCPFGVPLMSLWSTLQRPSGQPTDLPLVIFHTVYERMARGRVAIEFSICVGRDSNLARPTALRTALFLDPDATWLPLGGWFKKSTVRRAASRVRTPVAMCEMCLPVMARTYARPSPSRRGRPA